MNGRELCNRADMGDRQRAILLRAPGPLVMTLDSQERKAAMRLVRRGLLVRQRFGGPGMGWITVYKVVDQ